jgi:hypothetical protein
MNARTLGIVIIGAGFSGVFVKTGVDVDVGVIPDSVKVRV